MSEELRDEVEAINSIYGEGCLIPSGEDPNVYILKPLGESSSFRLCFPAGYPNEPPTVVGTNSTGEHGRRGDAARELSMFMEAVGNVFEPGMVCLYDAIEELKRLLEESVLANPQPDSQGGDTAADNNGAHREKESYQELMTLEPPWILSDPVVELKSTFIARCATVASTAEAEAFVQHLLSSDKKVRIATHNMTAWRIKGPNNTSFQDCNDDGETAAGGRLLHLMQLMDLWNVMVVVSRWYGGHKLGPRRFALINQVARDAFVKASLVPEPQSSKKKGSHKS